MWRSISFFIVLVFLTSCSDKEEFQDYSEFDKELWPYLLSFEEEAATRGIRIAINDLELEGSIREIEDDGVAGWCRYSPSQPNVVAIDEDFWKDASSTWREFVVFHELGHCILGRGHRETQDGQGNCISIMQSGQGSCRVAYSSQSRATYLDELFHPQDF